MIQTFEEYAQEYDNWFGRHESVYRSELAALQSLLPRSGAGLEIGVGTGRFAGPLGIKIGVEPARAMAAMAQNRGIQVIQGYAETLPVATASFDFILMVTVLCFLVDPVQALSEVTRALKPQGRLIIGMIDPNSFLGKVYKSHKYKNKFYRHARFYPVFQVLAWLSSFGYESISICQTIFRPVPEITSLEPVNPGHGEGGFVVLAGRKIN
jgi:SAM-dependent methyltransferase